MVKVLFINSLGSVSRGNIAVQTGCIKSIRASIPDAEITIWSMRASEETAYSDLGVKIRPHPWVKRQKSALFTIIMSSSRLMFAYISGFISRKNVDFDVLVSLSPDGFNDTQYGTLFTMQTLTLILFSKLILKKPMILVPASIGPFKHGYVTRFTKFVLNRLDIVCTRGETTFKYLSQIGITKPKTFLAADLGFLLDPCPAEWVETSLEREHIRATGRPLIGVAPSIEIGGWAFPDIKTKTNKKTTYVQLMAEAIDFIVEMTEAVICFIPNVAADPYTKESADSIAAKLIMKQMKHAENAKITSDSYSASEIKGIIGKCDLFFSCRMHSAIASTSMCVPTVVMAYGTKFDDVIGGTMGQQKCMVRIEASPEKILAELKSKLDYVWANRLAIKNELKAKAESADKQALQFGQLVKQAVNLNNEA